MRLKMTSHLQALLDASEARAKGENPPAPPSPKANAKIQRLLQKQQPQKKQDIPQECRIIGLDIALRKTGWGIIDLKNGQMTVADCGAIINKPNAPLSDCLRQLFRGVKQLLQKYDPQIASIEGGFFCMNQRTAIVLGAARGTTIGLLADKHVDIFEYAPRRVKQSVCGFGNASKQQVALLVSKTLHIDVTNLSDDTTDALALAICHANQLTTANGLGLGQPI